MGQDTSALQTGVGPCTPSHRLVIETAPEARVLGAAPDVIMGALNAVHHANRHGREGARIAAALPGLRISRGRAVPGEAIVLFAAPGRLEGLLALEGIDRLFRRGMVEPGEIEEVQEGAGAAGTAFVRDRRAAKRSPGALRRARARAERRGKPFTEGGPAEAPDPEILALHYGQGVVHLRALEGAVQAGPILVGTYGFSPASAPAVLPVRLGVPGEVLD